MPAGGLTVASVARPSGGARYFDVPVTGRVGLVPALLVSVRFARFRPPGARAGKVMLIWQFFPAATGAVQVPSVAVKSAVLDRLTAVIRSAAEPEFVITNGLVTVRPMAWVPRSSVGSLTWIWACVPVPESVTVGAPPGALLVRVSSAPRFPEVDGVNTTLTWQVPPAGMFWQAPGTVAA